MQASSSSRAAQLSGVEAGRGGAFLKVGEDWMVLGVALRLEQSGWGVLHSMRRNTT